MATKKKPVTKSAPLTSSAPRWNSSPSLAKWKAPVKATPAKPAAPVAPKPQDSAYNALTKLFESYGLKLTGDMLAVIKEGAIAGDSADLIQSNLQGTQGWKTRFAGNEKLRAAGLPVLSVAEYLSTERSYAQIMKNAGIPTGFYDDPADFAGFIGGSISPAEIQQRVNIAADVANREDPAIKNELARRGLSQGSLIAHVLDPGRAAPLLQKQYQSTLIGAAAARAGASASVDYATRLAELGVTEQQAAQGYGTVADVTQKAGALGDIYGVDYNQSTAEAEVFESSADAAERRRQLGGREAANFGGSSSYGVQRRNRGGSY